MNYHEQIKMFKKMIPIGVKNTSELINIMKTWVDVKEISLSDMYGYSMQSVIFNAEHCILNEDLQLSPNDMTFYAFEVIENKKSNKYYCDKHQVDKFLYVVFEERTGYVWSNSNLLFVKLELERGVSQNEYDTEGNLFRLVISHLAIAYCEENNIPMVVTEPEQ
jgi:hypothetical protein